MADLKALKKKKPANKKAVKVTPANKGTPPAPTKTTDNLQQKPREVDDPQGKLQLSIPESVINAYSEEAGKRFGFKKGSKSDLFMAMWKDYKAPKA